jgi:hypothetical protein
MNENHTRVGKTTVAFDGTLLAVDRAYWSAGGSSWNSTSKLQELQRRPTSQIKTKSSPRW